METTEPATLAQGSDVAQELEKHTKGLKSGANWFYWIAGLSLVNSVIQLFEGNRSFVVGLGITQIVDALAQAVAGGVGPGLGSTLVRAIALFIDLIIGGLFVLLGWQGSKKKAWAFALGIVFYLFDSLVFLLVRDWLSLAFHVFALICIFSGYSALRKLRALEVKIGVAPVVPGGA